MRRCNGPVAGSQGGPLPSYLARSEYTNSCFSRHQKAAIMFPVTVCHSRLITGRGHHDTLGCWIINRSHNWAHVSYLTPGCLPVTMGIWKLCGRVTGKLLWQRREWKAKVTSSTTEHCGYGILSWDRIDCKEPLLLGTLGKLRHWLININLMALYHCTAV